MATEEKVKNAEKVNEIVGIPVCNNESGCVKISNNVIAAIVRKYVLSVDGVVRTAPQGLVEGLANILGRKGYESSIGLELNEDGAVITLALVLRFGCNVPAVAKEIQDVLNDKIPSLTGYPVKKVNVNVIDLEEEEEEIEEAEEADKE